MDVASSLARAICSGLLATSPCRRLASGGTAAWAERNGVRKRSSRVSRSPRRPVSRSITRRSSRLAAASTCSECRAAAEESRSSPIATSRIAKIAPTISARTMLAASTRERRPIAPLSRGLYARSPCGLPPSCPRGPSGRWPGRCAASTSWTSARARRCAGCSRRRPSRPPPGGRGRWPRWSCSRRCPTRSRSTASASTTPPTRAETGAEPPEEPIVFAKMLGAVAPPGGPVRCPPVVRRLDYEGELCVVIGAGGRIAGYAVADDVSARDLQRREPSGRGPRAPTPSAPRARGSRPPTRSPDPRSLRLRTWVNGELRQDVDHRRPHLRPAGAASTSSRETCTLHPGDLILTGTPSGVGMASTRRSSCRTATSCGSRSRASGAIEHTIRDALSGSVLVDHPVDQAVLDGLVGLEEAVALHVLVDLLDRLARCGARRSRRSARAC